MEKRGSIQIKIIRRDIRSTKAARKYTGQRNASKNVCMQQEFEYWEFVGRRNGVARLFGQDRTFQISERVRSKCGKTTENAAGLECRQDILLSVGLCLSFRFQKTLILCQQAELMRSELFGKQSGSLPLSKGRWRGQHILLDVSTGRQTGRGWIRSLR